MGQTGLVSVLHWDLPSWNAALRHVKKPSIASQRMKNNMERGPAILAQLSPGCFTRPQKHAQEKPAEEQSSQPIEL